MPDSANQLLSDGQLWNITICHKIVNENSWTVNSMHNSLLSQIAAINTMIYGCPKLWIADYLSWISDENRQTTHHCKLLLHDNQTVHVYALPYHLLLCWYVHHWTDVKPYISQWVGANTNNVKKMQLIVAKYEIAKCLLDFRIGNVITNKVKVNKKLNQLKLHPVHLHYKQQHRF
jgi:hypothetical protein